MLLPPPEVARRALCSARPCSARADSIEEEEAGAPPPPPGLLLLWTGSGDPHSHSTREEDKEEGWCPAGPILREILPPRPCSAPSPRSTPRPARAAAGGSLPLWVGPPLRGEARRHGRGPVSARRTVATGVAPAPPGGPSSWVGPSLRRKPRRHGGWMQQPQKGTPPGARPAASLRPPCARGTGGEDADHP
ncbi:proline-rich protein HaeIII subfamily 1-like [Panicum virgatum]|uniref:proline-rich protein HaeIII subfamily 1-like n=1 Tax=Panicum virgatum TaxID=38727 RepID=UPI0019D56492|nr:proline-rich protein HaeIII subfamily 1-like [Panicum virgatum]